MEDQYRTIKDSSEGLYKEKGSKFLAFAYPVKNEGEIKDAQESLRKLHHGSRHHCYAWKLGMGDDNYRENDDGEPNNSAGKPIMGQIIKYDLTNILIVVVRYFGGTKLGVGGLINAYRTAAEDAINNASIKKRQLHSHYLLSFSYDQMNDVMTMVKEMNLDQYDQDFALDCKLKIATTMGESEQLEERLSLMKGVEFELLETK